MGSAIELLTPDDTRVNGDDPPCIRKILGSNPVRVLALVGGRDGREARPRVARRDRPQLGGGDLLVLSASADTARREVVPVLRSRFEMCTLTVFSLMNSASAISA